MMAVADLHCDLLAYLANGASRTAINPESRCSIPQFKKGGVKFQTLAIFTETGPGSVASCRRQFEIFGNLPSLYPNDFLHAKQKTFDLNSEKISLIVAIENGSGLLLEDERLDLALQRLEHYIKTYGPILYIGMTWKSENRFGGGNEATAGLKRDGEILLDFLSGKKIAIDLSHTSDPLAYDILNYIDKKGLKITPIASHSNFRKVTNQPRNLPDELAKEVFSRGGIMGLNFVRLFIGMGNVQDFIHQVEHAKLLGGMKQFCFGADFFYDEDFTKTLQAMLPFYFPKYQNASCYPELLAFLSQSFTQKELIDLSHQNLINFLERNR